jgi:hypothetical protein
MPFHSKRALTWRLSVANNKMYSGLQVKCPIFLRDFNKICIFSTYFLEVSNIKFHGNPSSASRADISGQTDRRTERLADMTNVIGSLYDYANAPKVGLGRTPLDE